MVFKHIIYLQSTNTNPGHQGVGYHWGFDRQGFSWVCFEGTIDLISTKGAFRFTYIPGHSWHEEFNISVREVTNLRQTKGHTSIASTRTIYLIKTHSVICVFCLFIISQGIFPSSSGPHHWDWSDPMVGQVPLKKVFMVEELTWTKPQQTTTKCEPLVFD